MYAATTAAATNDQKDKEWEHGKGLTSTLRGRELYKKSWSHPREHEHIHTDINIRCHFFAFLAISFFGHGSPSSAEQSRDNKMDNVRTTVKVDGRQSQLSFA